MINKEIIKCKNNININPRLKELLEEKQILFILGAGGTGKSFTIKELQKDKSVRQIVLASTGIAALNVEGQTIHSFLQLPPGLIQTNTDGDPIICKIYNKSKRDLIKNIQRIIIDEVSMVRADLLDLIDYRLRKIRENNKPFGGIQMVFVGDFYQLPPIVSKSEKDIFTKFYKSKFAFNAAILKDNPYYIVELTHIYRQSDEKFISYLNNIRNCKNIDKTLREINEQCVHFHRKTNTYPVVLAPFNRMVDSYNEKCLSSINALPIKFKGIIKGEFKAVGENLPVKENLILKHKARVMLVANDENKQYVNGSLGIIKEIYTDDYGLDYIIVKLDDGKEVQVERYEWTQYKYSLIEKEIVKEVVGTYRQFPIKLAYCLSIHKSQGLTMQDVRLNTKAGFFEAGQVYVALSRAMSIEGLSLTAPIKEEDIIIYKELREYLKIDEYID